MTERCSPWQAQYSHTHPLLRTAPPAGPSSPSVCLPDPTLAPGDLSACLPPGPFPCTLTWATPALTRELARHTRSLPPQRREGKNHKASRSTRFSFILVPLHRWLCSEFTSSSLPRPLGAQGGPCLLGVTQTVGRGVRGCLEESPGSRSTELDRQQRGRARSRPESGWDLVSTPQGPGRGGSPCAVRV